MIKAGFLSNISLGGKDSVATLFPVIIPPWSCMYHIAWSSTTLYYTEKQTCLSYITNSIMLYHEVKDSTSIPRQISQ